MGIKERWKGSKPLPEDIGERILNLAPLLEREGVLLAYLFGSLAHGERGEDVDLAILSGRDNFVRLMERIYELLNTQRVDLVDLKTASPVLKLEVIRQGSLIYKRNDRTENEFELSVLREYKDRAPVRRKQMEILKARMERRWS